MLLWLLNQFAPLLHQVEQHSSGDSRVFLTFRIALASVTSFVLALLLGPIAIRWLKGRFRERIDSGSERLNELHAGKSSTPTMGGLFIVAATVMAALVWGDLENVYVEMAIVTALGFGLLGAYDDWIKLSTQRNGLRPRTKLMIQTALASGMASWRYFEHRGLEFGTDLISPIGGWTVPLGVGFIAWGVLVIVGSSNGVNLTDGLDGLASGCTVFAGGAFVALAYLAGHSVMSAYFGIPFLSGCGELAVPMAALVGAVLGFLWFNCYPAEVFMGDTGALPIGALLGLSALATRQEVLLAVIGGVFVIETVSVILQVVWFKLTGDRLIACSPLHNHYLFRGQHEIKIVVRFWIGSALLAIVAIASLKIS